MNGILCYCTSCLEKGDAENGTCYLKRGGQCFSAVEEVWNSENGTFEAVKSFGCMSDTPEHDAYLQCQGNLVQSYYGRSISCCNYTDLCNMNLKHPQYKPRPTTIPSPSFFYEDNLYLGLLLSTIILGLLVLLSYITYTFYKTKKDDRSRKYLIKTCSIKLQKSHNGFPDCISSSGSGVGKPLLVRTSISRQVNRHQHHFVGRGRFTEVYVVEWNATKIIEKVFNTQNEARWFREKNIYETTSIRHENILGYISSDLLPSGLRAIYTDYHGLGSLHDYLAKTCLNYTAFLKLIKSASSGITQLHTEILGTVKRPAVAHCDITSKNFFINGNKECVISNFEISVMHISINDKLEMEPDFTSATPRYLAPEVVKGTMDGGSFDALKMADIYSLGLVFYEISQRCATVEGNRYTLEDHSLPFSNVLPKYPSLGDMQALYATNKPKEDLLFIPPRWENDTTILKPFVGILRECLYENPKSRPTAFRLKNNIKNLENADSRKDVDIL